MISLNKVFLFNRFKDFLEEDADRSRTKTIASNRNKSQGNSEKERTKRRKTRQEKNLKNTKNKTLSAVGDTLTPETDDNSNEYNINGIEESDFIFVKKWLKKNMLFSLDFLIRLYKVYLKKIHKLLYIL